MSERQMSGATLVYLLVTPSLLLPQIPTLPREARAVVRMQATAEAVAVIQDEPTEPAPLTEEEELRSLALDGAFAALGKRLEESAQAKDAAQVRAELFGVWTLVAASDKDASITGSNGKWKKGRGHFQIFKKPDPMAVFEGGDALFFMTTAEVVADVKAGTSSIVKVRGGFGVKEGNGVSEQYSRRDVGGVMESDDCRLINSWSCAYVGPTLRICRLADGGLRVYDKVEEVAAEEALVKLRAEPVEVDPAAAAEAVVKKVKKPVVVDDRPAWQKRIDEADGVKRTANGTPIINHGPIGGGGSSTP